MTRSERTPTNIEITVLDLSALEVEAFKQLPKEEYPKATRCRVGSKPHGIVETPKGVYALCNEGVGNGPITDDDKYEIDLYAEYDGGGWCMPVMSAKVNAEELKKLATAEKVNLADFIRQFGARLEANYHNWYKELEKAMA